MKFLDYLAENNEAISLEAIAKPEADRSSLMAPLVQALKHEEFVTASIHNIYSAAIEAADYRSQRFLGWFIDEQGEEEASARSLIARMELSATKTPRAASTFSTRSWLPAATLRRSKALPSFLSLQKKAPLWRGFFSAAAKGDSFFLSGGVCWRGKRRDPCETHPAAQAPAPLRRRSARGAGDAALLAEGDRPGPLRPGAAGPRAGAGGAAAGHRRCRQPGRGADRPPGTGACSGAAGLA